MMDRSSNPWHLRSLLSTFPTPQSTKPQPPERAINDQELNKLDRKENTMPPTKSPTPRRSNSLSRTRSRSPSRPHEHSKRRRRDDHDRDRERRHRHRHGHGHHSHRRGHDRDRRAEPETRVAITLPFGARELSKRDLELFEPMFAMYLDIQKGIFLEDLGEDEVKGRWKSFVGKW